MAKKVDIEQVELTANSVGIEPTKVKTLVSDLKQALLEEEELKEESPKDKNIFIIVANTSGKSKEFIEELENTPMNIIHFPENEDHNLVIRSISQAAFDFNNESKRGRKNPIKNIFEAISSVQAKFLKKHNITRKTKEPVIIISTDNILDNS